MSVKFLWFLIATPWCLSLFGQPLTSESTQNRLQSDLRKAASNNIVRVEVFYFPEDIVSDQALTPRDLERLYWAKTAIARFDDSQLRSTFLGSLAESNIQIRNGSRRDLRWGCIFFDSDNNRVVSLYLDRFGWGELNGVQIKAGEKFLNLLRQKFAFR